MKFRTLRADEIECRVGSISENGCSLLLYKDARVDQNVLDETVGSMNWQRHHSRDNANCIVSIWDAEKQQWIEKEDTGTESNTEAEKGLASDSFKRACFNWGIGRELYTAPFIWIPAAKAKVQKNDKGKFIAKESFRVGSITYDGSSISCLTILNRAGEAVYSFGSATAAVSNTISPGRVDTLRRICTDHQLPEETLAGWYKKQKLEELTMDDWSSFRTDGPRLLAKWDTAHGLLPVE